MSLEELLAEAREQIDALLAENEALRGELDYAKWELVHERSIAQARERVAARAVRVSPAHPSLQDPCPAVGLERPLRLVK